MVQSPSFSTIECVFVCESKRMFIINCCFIFLTTPFTPPPPYNFFASHLVLVVSPLGDHLHQRLQSPVEPDEVSALILLRQAEDSAGRQHLELGVHGAQVSHQVLNHSLRLHGQAVRLLGGALLERQSLALVLSPWQAKKCFLPAMFQ